MDKTERALVLRPDNSVEWVTFGTRDGEELKDAIEGGMLELITLKIGPERWVSAYLNEEGKLLGLPVNGRASALWQMSYGPSDVLVGPVVLFGLEPDDEGYEQGLTDHDIADLIACLIAMPS